MLQRWFLNEKTYVLRFNYFRQEWLILTLLKLIVYHKVWVLNFGYQNQWEKEKKTLYNFLHMQGYKYPSNLNFWQFKYWGSNVPILALAKYTTKGGMTDNVSFSCFS